jgi:hypothetical protein
MNDEVGTMKDEGKTHCFYFRVHRSAFIVSLDALSARLLASNSGLFTEGQAEFCCLTPRVVRAVHACS